MIKPAIRLGVPGDPVSLARMVGSRRALWIRLPPHPPSSYAVALLFPASRCAVVTSACMAKALRRAGPLRPALIVCETLTAEAWALVPEPDFVVIEAHPFAWTDDSWRDILQR